MGPVILNAKMDQFRVLNVVAGITPVTVPALLQVSLDVCKIIQGLFGCVKTAMRDGPDDINEIGNKLACIQKQLTDRQLNENKLENKEQKFIDERMLHIEQKLENKINLVIEKQQQIPDQIKTSRQKSNVSTPIPNMKKTTKETLQQQEQEKEDNEKRENNLVLFNVPESKLETPKEKESEDLQVFHQFCERA